MKADIEQGGGGRGVFSNGAYTDDDLKKPHNMPRNHDSNSIDRNVLSRLSMRSNFEDSIKEEDDENQHNDDVESGRGGEINTKSTNTTNNNRTTARRFELVHHKCIFAVLIVFVGAAAASAFVSLGITSFNNEQQLLFSTSATQFAASLEEAFHDYELFGLWIHESCRSSPYRTTTTATTTTGIVSASATTSNTATFSNDTSTESNPLGLCSRKEFRELYEYVKSVGLNFQSAQFMPNVTHAQRVAIEEDSARYYEQYYPHVNYRGITGLFPKPIEEGGGVTILPQIEQSFYFPVHYVEPVVGNEAAIELDLYTSQIQRKTIESAMSSWKPALTNRLRLVQETDSSQSVYSIILHHPGVPVSTRPELTRPEGSSLLVIRIPDLLERASRQQFSSNDRQVYLYDVTYVDNDSEEEDEEQEEQPQPVFLGAATISVKDGRSEYISLPEVDISAIHQEGGVGSSRTTSPVNFQSRSGQRSERRDMDIADRKWTVVVVAAEDAYKPNLFYVVLGGGIIFMASVILAIWFFSHMYRTGKLNEVKSKAEAEKAAIIVATARRQALAERQLNEYIAHEVRNPLSSAIAALSFVSSATEQQEQQLQQLQQQQNQSQQQVQDGHERQRSVKEDIAIIDSSLSFINELLRNMLDMNRAASKQMKIELSATDIMRDVLQPVAAILFLRGSKVKVLIDCPPNLVIHSDRLRLKQVILNLAINASKFVEEGFIRLGARVQGPTVKNPNSQRRVHLFVEDSGPGVPKEKRDYLFVKFQESLDMLSQGTGIGLCLCAHLAQLMGGSIYLDESFNSGVKDHPGSRFVVDLNATPLDPVTADPRSETDETESTLSWSYKSTTNGDVTVTKTLSTANPSDSVPHHGEDTVSDLPEDLSVLFCDDDPILRKLFTRSIRRVAPTWKLQEAANGETALHLVESQQFDIIFLDQYMASINKQLLGSETARALRARGVKSLICGLSANDVEDLFKAAGANSFMFKPFPGGVVPLKKELNRVLYDDGTFDRPAAASAGSTTGAPKAPAMASPPESSHVSQGALNAG